MNDVLTPPVAAPGGLLAQVMPLSSYQQSRPLFFPSEGALTWFVRVNRSRLVEVGALLLIRDRWHVDADRFDSEVFSIAKAAALRSVQGSAPRAVVGPA